MSNHDHYRFDGPSGTGRLRRAGWIVAVCGLFVAAGASAQVKSRALTEGIETGTDLVTLPSAPAGTLTATHCSGCPSVRLSFGPGTRYYIGDEAVTYARLREAASKGDLRLYVSYRIDNRTLTRLRLVATGIAQ